MSMNRVHRKPYLWNLAVGLPVSGYWSTDATWLRKGRKPTGRREPTFKADGMFPLAYAPGYQRMAFRWSVLAGISEETWGLLAHRPETYAVDAALVGSVTGALILRNRLRAREFERLTTEQALRAQLQLLFKTDLAKVKLGSKQLEIFVPPRVVVDERMSKELNDVVSRVIGQGYEMTLPNLRTSRRVVWTKQPEIVKMVTYADMREAMYASPEGTVILGLGLHKTIVSHDLNTDPHILMSAATGRGKSKTYANLLAQFLEWGSDVQVGDVKQISVHEFVGVEGITIHTTVEDIEDALNVFEFEMMERYDALKAVTVEEWPDIMEAWQRKIFMLEELNAYFSLEAQRYDTRTKIPSFATLGRILSMSRQVKMHVVVTGQKLDGRVLPNGIGENFGCRLFSNPTPSTWRALGEGKKPAGSRIAGRTVKLNGGDVEIYQATLMYPNDLIEHVATRRNVFSLSDPSVTWENDKNCPRTITLRDYADETGQNLEALRKAVGRSELRPVGKGHRNAPTYLYDDLTALRPVKLHDPTHVDASKALVDADGTVIYDPTCPPDFFGEDENK